MVVKLGCNSVWGALQRETEQICFLPQQIWLFWGKNGVAAASKDSKVKQKMAAMPAENET